MKLFTSLIVALMLAGQLVAQAPFANPQGERVPLEGLEKYSNKDDFRGPPITGWYGYAFEAAELFSIQSGFLNDMFPDNSVYTQYAGGVFDTVGWHSAGQTFDPYSENWVITAQALPKGVNVGYTIDSISFRYRYQREQTAVADTVVIQLWTEPDLKAKVDTSGATPPRSYAVADYDLTSRRGTNEDDSWTFILDDDDTAINASRWIEFPVGTYIDADEIVMAAMTYIPGNTWSAGDTLAQSDMSVGNPINSFTFLTIVDENDNYELGAWNHGSLVNGQVLKQEFTGLFADAYLPGNFFNDLIHIQMLYKITSDNISSVEGVNAHTVTMSPNPASSVLNIRLEQLTDQTIQIFDVNGVMVKSLAATSSNMMVDLSDLITGMYIVNVSGENVHTSERIQVIR